MGEPIIRMQDVTKSFGEQKILQGLSFEVRRGECLGLMGGSGTGKSVTLRLLVGLLKPDTGTIEVDGLDLARLTRHELADLRRRMGYVFQDGALINWLSVSENLALPLQENTHLGEEEIRAKVAEKLALVHVEGAADKMPSELSGGMRRRVGLARALITDPEIVLYDEPNAGLDPKIARSINHLMRELSDKLAVTSVVVEHRVDCLRTVADEVIFLYEGHALVRAATEEFFRPKNPILRDFLGT